MNIIFLFFEFIVHKEKRTEENKYQAARWKQLLNKYNLIIVNIISNEQ